MRSGGSKEKGANFEREVCKRLSRWVSNGQYDDCFWRSAMSGGRATVAQSKGQKLARQAGDITATAPEGHPLTNLFYIECKHYANLELLQFILLDRGETSKFWRHANREARRYNRIPLLIMKQNRLPVVVVTQIGESRMLFKEWLPHSFPLLKNVKKKWELFFFEQLLQQTFAGEVE